MYWGIDVEYVAYMSEPVTSENRSGLRRRILIFGPLLLLLPMGYIMSTRAFIPGYDPHFYRRETGNIRIFERDGKRYLWGGENEDQHFDISEFRLNTKRLEFGLGREFVGGLIDPAFGSIAEAEPFLEDDSKVLLVRMGGVTRAYPVGFMGKYEVVNDVIDGRPIFAAYCPLADLGAVYDRQFADTTYTFAVSGYTYYDWRVWRGYSAFVLWDRETESLWWPPLGKAVSGPSIDIPLHVLDRELWAQTTWAEVKAKYPNADVLNRRHSYQTPAEWTALDPPTVNRATRRAPRDSIAPRWGKNGELAP